MLYLSHTIQKECCWGLAVNKWYSIIQNASHRVPGFHQDWSAQVRVWTAETNSFWDRQKPQSFWGRSCFGLQTSRHLPARGEVSGPPGKALPQHLGETSWFPDNAKTTLHR